MNSNCEKVNFHRSKSENNWLKNRKEHDFINVKWNIVLRLLTIQSYEWIDELIYA